MLGQSHRLPDTSKTYFTSLKVTLRCVKVTGLGGTPGVILPNCEEIVEMTVEEDWAELVIASDGVWDVVSPHDMPQVGG